MKLIKVEMHLHTGLVSPCSVLSPLQIVRAYTQGGYGGVFVTDHYYRAYFNSMGEATWEEKVDAFLTGYREVARIAEQEDLRVYLGMEIARVHSTADLLLVGVDEDFLYNNPELYEMQHADLFKYVDERQVLMFHAHPFRYNMKPCPANQLHGIEVLNAHPIHESYNERARAFADKHPELYTICGSDAHALSHVCRGGIYLPDDLKDAREVAQYIRENGSPELVLP